MKFSDKLIRDDACTCVFLELFYLLNERLHNMKNNSSASVQTSKLTSKWRDTFNQHCMSLRRQDETLQHSST